MKQHLRIQDFFNTFCLSQKHPSTQNKVWVYVEGMDDKRLLGRFFCQKNVFVEALGGIVPVREIVKLILQNHFRNVLGIVDADFSRLQARADVEQNIFYTDCHDAEMMAIAAGGVFKDVTYICWQEPLDYDGLRERLLQSIALIGVTRKYSLDNKIDLNFQGLSVNNLLDICKEDGRISLKSSDFVQEINRRSPRKVRAIQLEEIEKIDTTGINLWELCNGHDYIKAWGAWLNTKASGQKGLGPDQLQRMLYAAFNFQVFCTTNLYNALKNWASAHNDLIFTTCIQPQRSK